MDEQSTQLQLDALASGGCDRIFSDHASGAASDRPVLAVALSHLHTGDIIVDWRLDCLGRTLSHLIEVVRKLEDNVAGFRSLTKGIDTKMPNGRPIFHQFGALAQFERELIRKRTRAGVAAARARGRHGGRPPRLKPGKPRVATKIMKYSEGTISYFARNFGVHRSILHNAFQQIAQREHSRQASQPVTGQA